jgi:hypothetical protein
VLHPGVKRLLDHVRRECRTVPDDLAQVLAGLLASAGRGDQETVEYVIALLDRLDGLLSRENLLPGRSIA